MVQRFLARFRRLYEDAEILFDPVLTDVLLKSPRSQRALRCNVVILPLSRRDETLGLLVVGNG
jgi:hypothetical protein